MSKELEKDEVRCHYCGAILKKKDAIEGRLTFIRNGKVVSEYFWYCYGKPCTGYDQMAHEG